MRFRILILLFSLSSCSTAFLPDRLYQERISLTEKNIEDFNGSYHITPMDSSYASLEYALFNKIHDEKSSRHNNERFVQLDILNEDLIKVSSFNGDSLLHQEELKYAKLDNSYIKVIVPSRLHHIGWGLFSYSTQETRIALSKSKNLIVDTCGMGTGIFLILPIIAADNHHYGAEYGRISY